MFEVFCGKLKILAISYNIYGDEIVYNGGEYNLKNTINKLRQLKNKHFFYIIPEIKGNDVNDELKNGNLKKLLSETILKEIENESILKCNKRTKEVVYWRPQKQQGTLVNDNLTREFIGLPYDNRGIAIRFLKRFGENYRKVYGIGICKYDDGKYKQKQEDNLFADIQQTILMTYYEYDYLVDDELKKSFKKLWIDKGVGEYKTIINIEGYIKRCRELNIDITEFDNENNNIINLSNGYYDLDKDKLMEHNRNKLFFRKLDTNYKSDIDLTNINNDWNKFLLSTFCDKINGNYSNDTKGLNNIRFLQKAMGYTFGSNNTNEEKVFMLLGQTRTGKSTCIDVIQEVMSSYSAGTQSEEFLTNDDTSNNYILGIKASLKGKRFLHISEISKSKRLNAAEIKRLAGDRFITAKYIYQQPFTFRNTVKYWISTNNIDFNNNEFDESIKTKLFIIDFNKRFTTDT